jgi:hypothetical protein
MFIKFKHWECYHAQHWTSQAGQYDSALSNLQINQEW